MYAYFFGHFGHWKRFKVQPAFVEKFDLVFYDRTGDLEQCVFTLRDGIHEPLGRAYVLLEKFARLAVDVFVLRHCRIEVVYPK